MTDTTGKADQLETWNASSGSTTKGPMYRVAQAYVDQARRFGQRISYDALIPALEYRFGQMTPDGAAGWMVRSTPTKWTKCFLRCDTQLTGTR